MPRLFILPIIAVLVLSPALAQARDQNNILTDRELTDAATMDLQAIDRFLKSKGAMGHQFFLDTDGIMRTPAEILWRIATTHSINPQFLLALMQKEQSLVDDRRPSQDQIDWATGYGVCDSCAKSDSGIQRFRGFARQIEGAARQIREDYLPRMVPGRPRRIDGALVVPANAATAAMYTYTPHLHGNRLLAEIWDRWFKKKFPEGSLLRTEDGSTHLLIAGTLRRIESAKVFRTIGFNPEEVEEVSADDLIGLTVGDPITKRSIYPQGALVQNKKTGGVYFVQDGIKHAIWSRELMTVNFPGRKMFKVAPSELEEYAAGAPVTFEDGTLVGIKKTEEIYLISGGKRNLLRSREALVSFGWDEASVIWTTRRAVELHPHGEVIEPEAPDLVPSP